MKFGFLRREQVTNSDINPRETGFIDTKLNLYGQQLFFRPQIVLIYKFQPF